jgi:UDP-N-acetylmuramoylalanine--D-glutamate ligase
MERFRDYFKRKKITVMRIGLLGRGIGDTAYMAEAGAEVLVVDSASQAVMQPAVDALAHHKNVTFKFGPYDFADFKDADMVLVGAGAPLDEPVLVACREAGMRLVQSAALFAQLSGVPIIGVTGTRGKSTVTHMIHHVLSFVTGEKVLLGGNVRGVSNLELLNEVKEDSLAVMELDSWQLQAFGWASISPHIAVFTNFMEDHLNYYKAGGRSQEEAMEAYFADKAQIFLHQEESGVLVTTREVFERAKEFARGKRITLGQEVKLVDASILPDDCLLSMPGEHNRLNAALAYEALKSTGLEDEEIFEGLASFPGVPGRLEYLGEKDGVKIYNDNNSTTPTATVVGLRAVGEEAVGQKKVVLIMGGDEKNLDMTPLLTEILKWCSKVVLFKERGTDRIRDEVFKMEEKGIKVYEEEGLMATVNRALEVAEPGEVILYSPAFSSFGKYFKNEYDRGDQFVELVKQQL